MAPDEWATESDVSRFLGDLARVLKPDVVLETGSYRGYTSLAIGLALAELKRGHLTTVEIKAVDAEMTRQRCLGLPVTVLTNRSQHIEPPGPIDLLFLDSGWEDRMQELRYFRQWASPRCVIAVHDSAVPESYPGVPGFFASLDAVVAEQLVQPWLKLPTPRGLALTRYC